MPSIKTLKDAWNKTPAGLKAKAIKITVKIALACVLLTSVYIAGRFDGADSYKEAIARQREAVNKVLIQNAVDSAQRFGEYNRTDAELKAAVAAAEQKVRDYYKANPVERKVPITKLVPVQGEPEYVYVPDGVCPNDFFGPDELRLWNLGNKRDFANAGN